VRRCDDALLWSGVPRGNTNIFTVALILKLRYWSLPLSLSLGSHVIGRFGLTLGLGPLYLSWSKV